jgi:hyperosmotically inducible protein
MFRRRSTSFLRAALVLVTAAALLRGVSAQSHIQLGDDQIRHLVEHRLANKDIRGVEVSVKDAAVTLRGTVPNLWAKNEAIEQARKADDVRSVVSDLTIARGESDAAVAEQIAQRVRRYVFYSIFDDVDATVSGGAVTLTGRVTMPYKAEAIAELASRVNGVQIVKNELRTLPENSFDSQLRYAIARQLYGDPLFWEYGFQVNPPIHIIVEHGRVTLTGFVRSEVERLKAESIVRGVFGVMSTENTLQLEGQRS